MAKNLEITTKMLEDIGSCEAGVDYFRETFGEKVVLNTTNIVKAAESLNYTGFIGYLLKDDDATNKYLEYRLRFSDEMHAANASDRCKNPDKRRVEYNIKCYTKFVELYRKENKAKRKPRGKNTVK